MNAVFISKYCVWCLRAFVEQRGWNEGTVSNLVDQVFFPENKHRTELTKRVCPVYFRFISECIYLKIIPPPKVRCRFPLSG
jgi:hypothetical protein